MLSHHDYFSAITSPWPAPAGEVDFGRLYVYNFIVRNFIITQHYEKKTVEAITVTKFSE